MSLISQPDDSIRRVEIATFYDDFNRRLLRDYVYGNPRVSAAIDRVCGVISDNHSNVLDIGCGIGTSTRGYRQRCPWIKAIGVDISPANTHAARRLFRDEQIDFRVDDMESAPDGHPFDVVALIDVYEHVPRDKWAKFNQILAQSTASKGVLVLTTPTPLHQNYLAEYDPKGLQIIDETVEFDDIVELNHVMRGTITCYEYVSIWHRHDYLHVVIDRNPRFDLKQWHPEPKRPFWRRVSSRLPGRLQADVRRRKDHVKRMLGIEVE